MTRLTLLATFAAASVAMPASATVYTLTFDRDAACDDLPCVNYEAISQSYGDVAGLDISYRTVDSPGDSDATGTVNYWDTDYGDLVDVAWGGFSASSGAAQIVFTVTGAATFSLLDMDFAGWPDTDRSSVVRLYTLDMTLLDFVDFNAPGVGHLNIACFGCTTPTGFVLEWGPEAFNAGIDNVRFELIADAAIPEPATWAMFIAGFGFVGAALRRRAPATA